MLKQIINSDDEPAKQPVSGAVRTGGPVPAGSHEGTADGKPHSDYWCFISYRHADNQVQDRDWATWLHQEIEHYSIPPDLVGTRNDRGDLIPPAIYPVFLDEKSLPADANLNDSISRALDRSRFLLVICSPRAVQSTYVAQEIIRFKVTGKGDRIMAAIIDGRPGDPNAECFPEPLRYRVNPDGTLDRSIVEEPIAPNFMLPNGKEGFTSAKAYRQTLRHVPRKKARQMSEAYQERIDLMKLRVIAGVLGLPVERLRNRHEAHQLEMARSTFRKTRNWLCVVSVLFVAATVGAWQAHRMGVQAKVERDAARQTLSKALFAQGKSQSAGDQVHRALASYGAAMMADPLNSDPKLAAYMLLTSGFAPAAFQVPFLEGGKIRQAAFSHSGDHLVALPDAHPEDFVSIDLREKKSTLSPIFPDGGAPDIVQLGDDASYLVAAFPGREIVLATTMPPFRRQVIRSPFEVLAIELCSLESGLAVAIGRSPEDKEFLLICDFTNLEVVPIIPIGDTDSIGQGERRMKLSPSFQSAFSAANRLLMVALESTVLTFDVSGDVPRVVDISRLEDRIVAVATLDDARGTFGALSRGMDSLNLHLFTSRGAREPIEIRPILENDSGVPSSWFETKYLLAPVIPGMSAIVAEGDRIWHLDNFEAAATGGRLSITPDPARAAVVGHSFLNSALRSGETIRVFSRGRSLTAGWLAEPGENGPWFDRKFRTAVDEAGTVRNLELEPGGMIPLFPADWPERESGGFVFSWWQDLSVNSNGVFGIPFHGTLSTRRRSLQQWDLSNEVPGSRTIEHLGEPLGFGTGGKIVLLFRENNVLVVDDELSEVRVIPVPGRPKHATASEDGSVACILMESGELLVSKEDGGAQPQVLTVGTGFAYCLLDADGNRCFLKLDALPTGYFELPLDEIGKEPFLFAEKARPVFGRVVNAGGETFLLDDDGVRLASSSERVDRPLVSPRGGAISLASHASGSGRVTAIGFQDGMVEITRDDEELPVFVGPYFKEPIVDLALVYSGDYFAALLKGTGRIVLVNARTGEIVAFVGRAYGHNRMLFDPGRNVLITWCQGNQLMGLDIQEAIRNSPVGVFFLPPVELTKRDWRSIDSFVGFIEGAIGAGIAPDGSFHGKAGEGETKFAPVVGELLEWKNDAVAGATKTLFPGSKVRREALSSSYFRFLLGQLEKSDPQKLWLLSPAWSQEICFKAASSDEHYLMLGAESLNTGRFMEGETRAKFVNAARFFLDMVDPSSLATEGRALYERVGALVEELDGH